MGKVALNTMVAPETLEAIRGMATGKSQGQVVDEAIAALQGGDRHGEVNRWFRETWTRLEGLPDADAIADVVRSVIAEFKAQKAMPSQIPSASMPANNSISFDPASIPGVSVGVPKGFPCRCVHSGCKGSKFQGASKYANLCLACQESGHRGDPRNCQECFNDMGPS